MGVGWAHAIAAVVKNSAYQQGLGLLPCGCMAVPPLAEISLDRVKQGTIDDSRQPSQCTRNRCIRYTCVRNHSVYRDTAKMIVTADGAVLLDGQRAHLIWLGNDYRLRKSKREQCAASGSPRDRNGSLQSIHYSIDNGQA